jgi:hypothetical protein
MSNVELNIKIVEGKIIPPDILQLKQVFDNLSDGRYKITFKKLYRKATHSQFGYLFGLIHKSFMDGLLSQGWEIESIKDVEEICKQLFCSKSVLNKSTGEIFNIPESRSQFTTTDMMAYVENIRNYSAENLGWFIPDPDPFWAENLEKTDKNK